MSLLSVKRVGFGVCAFLFRGFACYPVGIYSLFRRTKYKSAGFRKMVMSLIRKSCDAKISV